MSAQAHPAATNDRELVLTRLIDASPEALYRCWTDPELMKQWFAPLPWTTSRVENDLRAGGSCLIVMKSPEGEEYPNPGIYMEVVPGRKLVFTDAYTSAWVPSAKPFMTATITFEKEGDKTRYTARVLHWTIEDRETHEKMGFHAGWGQCADQLAKLAATL
ncbi:MAG: hypothetical protein RJB62_1641 [Pseudomonadota bacterium]|jgi:uncharacterized protein YndB with AHSA1/START domain